VKGSLVYPVTERGSVGVEVSEKKNSKSIVIFSPSRILFFSYRAIVYLLFPLCIFYFSIFVFLYRSY
jgi:hypothetical protein